MILKNNIKTFFVFALGILVMVNSSAVIMAVKNALIMCYNSVIPSLYIFMVISNYIASSGSVILCLPFIWYGRLLKIQDRKFSLYILLSLIGGFAVGATLLNNLKDDGYSGNVIKAISPVMINNSASFCIMAVGTGLLNNTFTGFLIYISLVCASLITGFVLSFIYKYNIVSDRKFQFENRADFVNSINQAVQSIISICGFVVLFYCICEVIKLYISNSFVRTIIYCLTEITCGCIQTVQLYGKNRFILCFCLSIIPFSTLSQVYYFTHNAEIVKTLITSRFIHTPVSMLIFSVLINIFPRYTTTVSQRTISVRLFYNTMEISSVLFLLTFAFLVISDSNKLFTKRI